LETNILHSAPRFGAWVCFEMYCVQILVFCTQSSLSSYVSFYFIFFVFIFLPHLCLYRFFAFTIFLISSASLSSFLLRLYTTIVFIIIYSSYFSSSCILLCFILFIFIFICDLHRYVSFIYRILFCSYLSLFSSSPTLSSSLFVHT
jgi:hypothetical protein